MKYNIVATSVDDELWQVDILVSDHGQDLLSGRTHVCCPTAEEANEYAERTFLPDLRRNFPKKIAALTLAWEEAALHVETTT